MLEKLAVKGMHSDFATGKDTVRFHGYCMSMERHIGKACCKKGHQLDRKTRLAHTEQHGVTKKKGSGEAKC